MFDVIVIGAGIAGLVCAQQLQSCGYKVVVVEKSRGLGGRVATRRLSDTRADHGACYLSPKGELLGRFVQLLCSRGILQVWTDTVYKYSTTQQLQAAAGSPRYIAPDGMSAIAKFLATGLEIRLQMRVEAITPVRAHEPRPLQWHLSFDSSNTITQPPLTAKAVVMAIPAPQALTILQPLAETGLPAVFLEQLRCVEFDPCLTVIAGYPALLDRATDWKAITFVDDSDLGWIGLDSSKRLKPGQSLVFVLHSSAEFARLHLEAEDLQPFGRNLLTRASEYLLPPLAEPEWMQVHRWRYAFPSHPLQATYLSTTTPLPLVCCGDWCGGNLIESAMHSGIAAAEQINLQLDRRSLSEDNFFDFLSQA